ncbi:MAG: hypothetical protein HPY73_07710 [Methanomassiliicoccales archaeon]|nr:MAG: hypothetical protein HPY73_07710 [Methanomassiliicoccales archaeon]
MSNPLAHASFAFMVAAPYAALSGVGKEMAFIAAIASMLLDLDAVISPSNRYEHALHSPTVLAISLVAPLVAMLISIGPFIPCLLSLAVTSHLVQDVLQGEIGLENGIFLGRGNTLFHPKIANVIDLASIPVSLVFMMLF